MAHEKSSKRLASIAAKYLKMGIADFHHNWGSRNAENVLREVKALAASVLTQFEPKAKKQKLKK